MIHFLYKLYMRMKHPGSTIRSASIARHTRLEENITLERGSHIQAGSIGKYTYISKYCLIDKNTESIGRFCSIAYNVKIGLGNHPTGWVSTHPFAYDMKYDFVNENISFQEQVTEKARIGNDVWIGAGAIVLAGVRVGDGAIIGANAVVTDDVEPYSIVTGIPARHKRYRFDEETRKALREIEWWNWDKKKIKSNIALFQSPKNLIEKFG